MDFPAIEERLRSIDQSLQDLRETARDTQKRVGEAEKWRAATETVIEMQIERINNAMDTGARNSEWINRASGGRAAVIQLISSVSSALGIIVIVAKLFLSKG